MAAGHAYGNFYAAGDSTIFAGDYQPTTHIHYGEQRQNIRTILLESLTFERWDARIRNVVPALDRTCEWIFSHEHFQAWFDPDHLSRHGGFLWLRGKPGSGKSTVMKKVVDWAQKHKSDYTTLSYFFNARSPRELEKSSLGLYRSLTYQLLSMYPDGVTTFMQMFSSKTQHGRMVEEWTVAELQSFWLRLVTIHKLPPCLMLIDALDEGSEHDMRSMIDFMVDLVDQSRHNSSTILMFLSSRYYPGITIDNSLPVLIEEQDGHQEDIRLYVSKKLKGGTTHGMNELRQLVFTRSQGVFLWVVLVMPSLNEWYDQGHDARSRIKKLEKVPAKLSDVFSQILFGNTSGSSCSSDTRDLKECIFLFQWVLFSLRALRPDELSTAVQTLMNVLEHEDVSDEDDEDDATNIEMTKRRLIHLSRGLIEFTTTSCQPVVQLVHETVRDFLLGKSYATGADQGLAPQHDFTTHLDASACHCALAKICLSRLITVASRPPTSSREQDILAGYAAKYWWQHVEEASGGVDEEVLRLATELCLTPSCLRTWLQNYQVDRPWRGEYYNTHLSPSEIATPLYYVACIGYEKLFSAILDNGADIDAQGGHYGNALQAASYQGHEKVVQMLLDKGANVNAQGGTYGNALQAASLRGHEKVVQTLLDKEADVNAQGGHYGNALQAASARGHEKVVQMLLDKEADVNAQGGHYGNALQAASFGGHEKVVQMLLEKGAEVNAQGGYYGNALVAASLRGHVQVMQMLLDKEADVNAQGGHYGNALVAASLRGPEKVVQMLLEKGADVNAQGGEYGTALVAASSGGPEKVVQMLLDQQADVNAQGGLFGNALQAASYQGHEEVVQMLLEKGADVHAQGGKYGNALQAASFSGSEKVVQMLLEKGADVNAQGGHYGSALQTASAEGHEKVVQLLRKAGAS